MKRQFNMSISYYAKFFLSFLATYVSSVLANDDCLHAGTCRLSELADGLRGFVLEGESEEEKVGYSVSAAGDINGDGVGDLLIGAVDTSWPQTDAGKTYVVFGSNDLLAWGNGVLALSDITDGERGFVLEGESAGDCSGYSVSAAGDINGDDLDDLLIGALLADVADQRNAGKAYMVFGTSHPTAWGNGTLSLSEIINGVRGFVLRGETANDQNGCSVNTAGDMNGDGIKDFFLGACHAGHRSNHAGKAYVVFGSNQSSDWENGTLALSNFIDGERGFVLEGEPGSNTGVSLSAVEDINGDGLEDLLIGAHTAGADRTGSTYVVLGSNSPTAWHYGSFTLSDMIDNLGGFKLDGERQNDRSGSSVSITGDINGDGVGDILIGAPRATVPLHRSFNRNEGKTYVVFGSKSARRWDRGRLLLNDFIDGTQGFVLEGEANNDLSGFSVSTAGDINNDGLEDLLIGAYNADPDPQRRDAGKTYVVFGNSSASAWSSGTLSLSEVTNGGLGFVLEGDSYSEQSGFSVSKAGDINGDGFGDIIVGAPGASRAYVIFGFNRSLPAGASSSPSIQPTFSKTPIASNTPHRSLKVSSSISLPNRYTSSTVSASPTSGGWNTTFDNNQFNLVTQIPRIICFTLSGLTLVFLGMYAGFDYQSRQRMSTAIRLYKTGLLEKNKHYQRNTLQPMAAAILERLNIRGCGVLSLRSAQGYLDAIDSIINALQLQDIETDLSKLTRAQRECLLTNLTEATYVELIGHRQCGSRAWCVSFFKVDITPGQLLNAADRIALRVKQTMSSEHKLYSSSIQMSMFHSNQEFVLHHAIINKKSKAEIEALITATPAHLHQRNQQEKLPVEVAAEAGLLDIVELLFAKGSPGDQVKTIQQALGAQQAIEHKSLNPLTTF